MFLKKESSMGPKVWSKRSGADKAPSGAVYIGRPTKWGNPFVEGTDGTREEVIAKFRAHAIATGLWKDAMRELKGKHLVCWCAPLACHGDVLLAFANAGDIEIAPRTEVAVDEREGETAEFGPEGPENWWPEF